jgi:hypothetical protein
MGGFDLVQLAKESGNIRIRHRRMMPAGKLLPLRQYQRQMTAPGRRVFTRSEAVGFPVIKHRLDPAAKARSCFWNPVPNWLQDRKNRRRVYRIDRLIENRPAIIIDRCAPLRRVDLATPFAPLRFYEFIGALAERLVRRRGLLGGLFRLQRVNALGEHGTVAEGQLPRFGEGHSCGRPEPGFTLLAGDGLEERPPPGDAPAGFGNREIEVAPVGVTARLFHCRDGPRRQSFKLSRHVPPHSPVLGHVLVSNIGLRQSALHSFAQKGKNIF